ncbi:hypothetical protein ABT185_32175 [Streptomyces clavifer]|uniref:hypothetical protein n=1 Tax=Streptomyces clavifer TaxID=68188 RepID=UPI00332DC32D
MAREGKDYYYLTDAFGSVVAMADETGTKVNNYSYSPQVSSAPPPARRCPSTTGSSAAARPPPAQEENPHFYAEGDAVNRIDPSGLLSLSAVVGALGAPKAHTGPLSPS